MTPSPTVTLTSPVSESSPALSESLCVRALTPEDAVARDAFVRSHPQGTLFHLAGWERAVERTFGHKPVGFGAWRGAELVGLLPLMRCKKPKGPADLISAPYAVYGGPLAVEQAVSLELVQAAKELAVREGIGRVELRCREESGLDLPSSDLYVTFIKELPDTVEAVLAGMPKKSRAEARKARERKGLRLEQGWHLMPEFLRLYLFNKRGLGSPAMPAKFFSKLREELGDQVVMHGVLHDDRILTVCMSFLFEGDMLAYYSGAGEGVDREFSASNFQYMALQEWAVSRGMRRFDFGRSRADSGARRFKEHQGFVAAPLPYRYILHAKPDLPSFNPSNPKTQKLRDTWTKLPLWVARPAGGFLSRYLP